MNGAQDHIQAKGLHHLSRRHDQQFADQGALQFLVAAGALAQGQDGGGRGDDIDDADEGFLGHALVAAAREGQHHRADEREPEREGEALPVVDVVADKHGDAGAEGGGLGQRQVHEDHAALDDVQPEVDQQPGQNRGSRSAAISSGRESSIEEWSVEYE